MDVLESESPDNELKTQGNISNKLHHEGFQYIIERIVAQRQKKYWRCENYNRKSRKCSGRLHTNMDDEVLAAVGEHTCNQIAEEDIQDTQKTNIKKEIKRRASEDAFLTPYQQQVIK